MLSYRKLGNARLEAAIEFIRPHLRPGDVVVDIGCGVGIVIEALARDLPESHFLGVDLSEANIRNARETVKASNVEFVLASVTEQFSELRSRIGRSPNAICMVDVIEHVPEVDRPSLFANLADMASSDCMLLTTYPSPEYQRHLLKNNPEERQIIDNVIEIDELLREASVAGWRLRYLKYIDVWHTNQYIHVALARDLSLKPLPAPPAGLFRQIARSLRRAVMRPVPTAR